MLTWSFLILRKKEPDLEKPYKVTYGEFVGILVLVRAIGMTLLYLPDSPVALLWPQEWGGYYRMDNSRGISVWNCLEMT